MYRKLFVANRIGLILLGVLDSFAMASELKISPRLYRSPHFLGRGDTGIAASEDQEAAFYNPAGLALGKGIFKKVNLISPAIETSKGTRDLVRKIAIEEEEIGFDTLRSQIGKTQHVGLSNITAIVLRRVSIGAFTSTEANLLVYKSKEEGGLEAVDANLVANAGLNVSLAEAFFSDRFLIGGTGRYLRRGVAEASFSILDASSLGDISSEDYLGYGSAYAFDLGMMLRDDKAKVPWSLGLVVENLGQTSFKAEDEDLAPKPKDLKQVINVGVMFQPGTKLNRLKLLADYRDITQSYESSFVKRLHLGAELSIREIIGFTAGLHQGYPGGGIYLDVRVLRLDLLAYTEELGNSAGSRPDPRYGIRLSAGF